MEPGAPQPRRPRRFSLAAFKHGDNNSDAATFREELPQVLESSPRMCRAIQEDLQSAFPDLVTTRSLEQVLADAKLRSFLVRWSVAQCCSEIMLFWLECKELEGLSGEDEQKAVARIVAAFVASDAPLELNLSGSCKEKVMRLIKDGMGSRDALADARYEMDLMLAGAVFPGLQAVLEDVVAENKAKLSRAKPRSTSLFGRHGSKKQL
jgi:hypothetical protein